MSVRARSWPQPAGIARSPVREGRVPHRPGTGWADREKNCSRWIRPQAGQQSGAEVRCCRGLRLDGLTSFRPRYSVDVDIDFVRKRR